jgi:flagellar biosynthesis anti-sigma factor FlgM
MKITSTQRLPEVITTLNGTATGSAKKATPRVSDRVELTGSNQEINKLKTILQQVPDPSIAKIPQIKQQLDDSTYHVEAKAVAEKMLDRWKDFTS